MNPDHSVPQLVVFVIDQSAAMDVPFGDGEIGIMIDGAVQVLNELFPPDPSSESQAFIEAIGYSGSNSALLARLPGISCRCMFTTPSDDSILSLEQALSLVDRGMEEFLANFPDGGPPIVIHVTATTSVEPAAAEMTRKLMSRGNSAGPVAVYRVHFANNLGKVIMFPRSVEDLPPGKPRQLFELTSVVRSADVSSADEKRRGLCYRADAADFRGFLKRVLPFVNSPDATPEVPAVPFTAAPAFVKPRLDDNVQFTTYCPRSVAPEVYATVLAFAHLEELRPDAAANEPHPVAEMKRQARSVLGDAVESYRTTTQESRLSVPREGELIFTLEIDGFRCNPPRQTVFWEESVHRVEFRIKAPAALDGTTCRGQLRVFLGDLLLAETTLRIAVSSTTEAGTAGRTERHEMQRYRKIFASYCRRDMAIVEQFERYAETMGDTYLRDLVDLRSGENWNDGLKQLIREADVFQLFWSTNSMNSPFVRAEWLYALSLSRPNFIRPMYWEQPFPEQPPEMPPPSLRDLHFKLLGRFVPIPADAVVTPENVNTMMAGRTSRDTLSAQTKVFAPQDPQEFESTDNDIQFDAECADMAEEEPIRAASVPYAVPSFSRPYATVRQEKARSDLFLPLMVLFLMVTIIIGLVVAGLLLRR